MHERPAQPQPRARGRGRRPGDLEPGRAPPHGPPRRHARPGCSDTARPLREGRREPHRRLLRACRPGSAGAFPLGRGRHLARGAGLDHARRDDWRSRQRRDRRAAQHRVVRLPAGGCERRLHGFRRRAPGGRAGRHHARHARGGLRRRNHPALLRRRLPGAYGDGFARSVASGGIRQAQGGDAGLPVARSRLRRVHQPEPRARPAAVLWVLRAAAARVLRPDDRDTRCQRPAGAGNRVPAVGGRARRHRDRRGRGGREADRRR